MLDPLNGQKDDQVCQHDVHVIVHSRVVLAWHDADSSLSISFNKVLLVIIIDSGYTMVIQEAAVRHTDGALHTFCLSCPRPTMLAGWRWEQLLHVTTRNPPMINCPPGTNCWGTCITATHTYIHKHTRRSFSHRHPSLHIPCCYGTCRHGREVCVCGCDGSGGRRRRCRWWWWWVWRW